MERLATKSVAARVQHLLARIAFRGIYFPQMSRFQWFRVFSQNRRLAWDLFKQGWAGSGRRAERESPPTTVGTESLQTTEGVNR